MCTADGCGEQLPPKRAITYHVATPVCMLTVAVVAAVDAMSVGEALSVLAQTSYATALATELHAKVTGLVTFDAPSAGAISDGPLVPQTPLPLMVVVNDAELSALFGSPVCDEMLALTATLDPVAGAVALIVIVLPAPTGMDSEVQLTFDPAMLQFQPGPLADVTLTPLLRVTKSTAFCATDGPLFATVALYESAPPGVALEVPLSATLRSASGPIGMVALDVPVHGPFVTVTPSVSDVPVPAVKVIDDEVPPAVIVPPVIVHAYVDPAGPAGTLAMFPVDAAPTADGAVIVTVGWVTTVTLVDADATHVVG